MGRGLDAINILKGLVNYNDHVEFDFDRFLYKCLKPDENHHKQCMLKM